MKTIRFKMDRQTKNTVRYEEVPEQGQPPAVGTLYVQKWAVPEGGELELVVTVAAPQ